MTQNDDISKTGCYAHSREGRPVGEWEPLFTPFGDGEGECRGESVGKVDHSTAAQINFVDPVISSSPSVSRFLSSPNLMKTIDSKALKLPDSLIAALGAGEIFALMGQSGLVAFLVPAHPPATKRPFGLAKGEFTVPADFNDPLPELEHNVYGS